MKHNDATVAVSDPLAHAHARGEEEATHEEMTHDGVIGVIASGGRPDIARLVALGEWLWPVQPRNRNAICARRMAVMMWHIGRQDMARETGESLGDTHGVTREQIRHDLDALKAILYK
jgi:hypothetical protein